MAIVDITPAPFPENIWSVGSIAASTKLPPDSIVTRLQGSSRPWRVSGLMSRGYGWVLEVTPRGFKLWKSTYFRQSPSRGAVVLDAVTLENGVGTQVTGSIRMGYGLLISYAIVALVFFALFNGTSYPAGSVFLVLYAVQLVVLRVLAQRELGRMTDFLRLAVDDGEAAPVPG